MCSGRPRGKDMWGEKGCENGQETVLNGFRRVLRGYLDTRSAYRVTFKVKTILFKEKTNKRKRDELPEIHRVDPVLIIHTSEDSETQPQCLLQQTDAVLLPLLTTGIMIRLKALTAETWTYARWWEQFAAQSTANEGGSSAPLAAGGSGEEWRGARRKCWMHPKPQNAAGDSTVPIVEFHHRPRLCLSFPLPLVSI